MRFSRLSEEAARDMLAAAADPAYRALRDAPPSTGSPAENLEELCRWLRVLGSLSVDLSPSRERIEVSSFVL